MFKWRGIWINLSIKTERVFDMKNEISTFLCSTLQTELNQHVQNYSTILIRFLLTSVEKKQGMNWAKEDFLLRFVFQFYPSLLVSCTISAILLNWSRKFSYRNQIVGLMMVNPNHVRIFSYILLNQQSKIGIMTGIYIKKSQHKTSKHIHTCIVTLNQMKYSALFDSIGFS